MTGHIKLPTVSVTEALVEVLRQQIMDCELTGGTQITEEFLSKQYGVSRPTARDAMTVLITTGLFYRASNRFTYVASYGPADIEELLRLIAVLAPFVDDISMPAAIKQAGPDLKLAFYRALQYSCDSPRVRRNMGILLDELQVAIIQSRHQSPPQKGE